MLFPVSYSWLGKIPWVSVSHSHSNEWKDNKGGVKELHACESSGIILLSKPERGKWRLRGEPNELIVLASRMPVLSARGSSAIN